MIAIIVCYLHHNIIMLVHITEYIDIIMLLSRYTYSYSYMHYESSESLSSTTNLNLGEAIPVPAQVCPCIYVKSRAILEMLTNYMC